MRRALVLVALCAQARAAPWGVTAETGVEIDDNVQRVETGPGLDLMPVSSGVLRFGLRADHQDKVLGGSYVLGVSDLTRVLDNATVSVENVTVLAGDFRYLHPIGQRPVLLGVGLTGADAFPLTDEIGARTFRNLGADGVLVVRSGDDHHLTLSLGERDFVYKPDHTYDWAGLAANARLDLILWQPPGKTRSLELVTSAGFEARSYNVTALVNACPPNVRPDPSCSTGTDLPRRDRFERAAVELTWVGSVVATAGYQVSVIDSNSYGQSLLRHRATASATMAFGKTFVTVLANLQIDSYLDGLLVQRDLQHTEFTNIEDENRSSLQARVARKLSDAWSLEGRAAVWRNLAGGSAELAFHRELIYGGLIYAK